MVGNLGRPLVAARWSLRWLVPGVPAQPVGPPPNPLDGTVGGSLTGKTAPGLKQPLGFTIAPNK